MPLLGLLLLNVVRADVTCGVVTCGWASAFAWQGGDREQEAQKPQKPQKPQKRKRSDSGWQLYIIYRYISYMAVAICSAVACGSGLSGSGSCSSSRALQRTVLQLGMRAYSLLLVASTFYCGNCSRRCSRACPFRCHLLRQRCVCGQQRHSVLAPGWRT
jgi:hypothetical protein